MKEGKLKVMRLLLKAVSGVADLVVRMSSGVKRVNVDGQQVLFWPPERESNLEEGLKGSC